MQRLLGISVWADLRTGASSARLLQQIAPRLGLARVVLPAGVPLGDAQLAAQLMAPGAVVRDGATPSGLIDGTWWIPARPGRDVEAEIAAAPAGARIVLDVPVAIGRTVAEATARADSDPVFELIGTPTETGIFGRLEDAQLRVAELAALGVGELACILPAPDLLDHLAQLMAVNVGSLDTHAPGTPRSADPAPPAGWGSPPGVSV